MDNRRFFKKEPARKTARCSCGKEAKLVKRRNFPFGRKSGGSTYIVYKCNSCNQEIPLIKPQEVKR